MDCGSPGPALLFHRDCRGLHTRLWPLCCPRDTPQFLLLQEFPGDSVFSVDQREQEFQGQKSPFPRCLSSFLSGLIENRALLRYSRSRARSGSPWPTELGHRRFLICPSGQKVLAVLVSVSRLSVDKTKEMCLLCMDFVHRQRQPQCSKVQGSPNSAEGLSPSAPSPAPASARAQPHPWLAAGEAEGWGVGGGKGAWETSLVSECCP